MAISDNNKKETPFSSKHFRDHNKMDALLNSFIGLIDFIGNVSTKIHNLKDKEEIFRVLRQEFINSKDYGMSLFLLTDNETKLKIVAISIKDQYIKLGSKIIGVGLEDYRIDLSKSATYRRVIEQGDTFYVDVFDTVSELFPNKIAEPLLRLLLRNKKLRVLTPLIQQGKIIGVFSLSPVSDFGNYLIPSVKNFASHISNALELTDEHAKLVKIQKELLIKNHAVESATIAIGITNLKGEITYVNKSCVKMWGYESEEEIIGRRLSEFFQEEKRVFRVIKNVKEKGFDSGEDIGKRKDGSLFDVIFSANIIKDDSGQPVSMMGSFIDITEKKKIEKEMLYRSHHDQLTGLYNRFFIEEEIKRLDIDRQLPISIIIGDVNGLKLTNDRLGHQKGDELLKKMAEILKNVSREEDVVGRWGGDEFLLLLPRTNENIAREICCSIKNACGGSVKIDIPLSIALGEATKTDSNQNLQDIIIKAEERMYANKLLNKNSIRNSLLSALQTTLNEKSSETQKHTQYLKILALSLGRHMRLSNSELDLLELLATLHDIGKLAVARHIIVKPNRLSPDEWVEIKRHPEIGYRIVKLLPELISVAEAVRAHHEWWNGDGYPHGLKQEEIPLISRIIAVVDAYEVMVYGKRSYTQNVTSEQALHELQKYAGSQFDPEIVRVFIEMVKQGKEKLVIE
ncbi:MAG: diguanylate cyclase [Parcubacteria group bacterium]|nr:diguanylate cyclase [Parcubacteria group bacterium]